MDTPTSRLLTPDHAEAYSRLRTAMLIDTPRAFVSSPGDAHGERPDAILEYLANPHQAITVIDHPDKPGELAAAAGLMRLKHHKVSHRADIWGVYCVPELRGRGLGRAVTIRAIEHAQTWNGVERVGLSVSAQSPGALALYESLGFVRWGLEPDAMRIDGDSFDEIHLSLHLDSHVDMPVGS